MPAGRGLQAAVYAANVDRVLMYGGFNLYSLAEGLDDLWSYDPSSAVWTHLMPEGAVPPARGECAMGYDPETGKVLIFGGRHEGKDLCDTWSYDPVASRWTDLKPKGTPPGGGVFGRMVYDPDAARMLLLLPSLGDDKGVQVWSYDADANSWTEVVPADMLSPWSRGAPSVLWAADMHKLIMMGGSDSKGAVGRVAFFDPAARMWTDEYPMDKDVLGDVSLGTSQNAGYDPDGNRVLFCLPVRAASGDVSIRTFSYQPAQDRWSELTTQGEAPPITLRTASFVYDSRRKAFILLQGATGPSDSFVANSDVWTLTP